MKGSWDHKNTPEHRAYLAHYATLPGREGKIVSPREWMRSTTSKAVERVFRMGAIKERKPNDR